MGHILKNLFSLVPALIVATSSFPQCDKMAIDNFYSRAPEHYNEPRFDLYQVTEFKAQSPAEYTLEIDTSVKWEWYPPYNFHEGQFQAYASYDSSKEEANWFIKDLEKDTVYDLGLCSYIERRNFTELNDILFCNFCKGNFLFDFRHRKLIFSGIRGNRIGNDDTSIYLQCSKFKYQKEKYYYGTIIQFSISGIQIISPRMEKRFYSTEQLLFQNKEYKVTRNFLYKEEKDCETIWYNRIRIIYNGETVDSFIDHRITSLNPSFRNDTLFWYDYPKEIRYCKGEKVYDMNYQDYIDQLADMKLKYYRIRIMNNILLLQYELYPNETVGLMHENDKVFTLNRMPYDSQSDAYQIVAVFDLRSGTFTGYPKLIFK